MAKKKSGAKKKTRTTKSTSKKGRSKKTGTNSVGAKKAASKSGAKKAVAKKAGRKKKSSGKRELIENRAGDFFARRSTSGQFKEMDERGRLLTADRRTKAKTVAKKGQGDRGDQQAWTAFASGPEGSPSGKE